MKLTESRTAVLMVMLTDEEKAKIAEQAKKRGMTMSAYCRMILIDAANMGGGEVN